ncbi:unnamed protein product [Caenorhabditis auriculariae]|uniref:FBA domain-containing protein n=1 Tax=Caenorhabditis auriculariae TaxID=2777116 RepID=A0A8S1HEP8_9PELO|nr:unnamed protein product [Caenorhabditis auriculariae]
MLQNFRVYQEILTDDNFWVIRADNEGRESCLPPELWRYMFKTAGVTIPANVDATGFLFDCAKIYLSGKGYGKHSVLNLREDSTMEQLEMESDVKFRGGLCLAIESPPQGCLEQHPEVQTCFATTFRLSHYKVCIDLTKWGIEEWVLDYVRPTIRITELVAPRTDCASRFDLYARLAADANKSSRDYLDPKYHSFCKLETREWPADSGCGWNEVTVKISEYPIGMRFLNITSGGKDTQFWDGHYGPKMARLQVEIVLPNLPRILPRETWADTKEPHKLVNEPFD